MTKKKHECPCDGEHGSMIFVFFMLGFFLVLLILTPMILSSQQIEYEDLHSWCGQKFGDGATFSGVKDHKIQCLAPPNETSPHETFVLRGSER